MLFYLSFIEPKIVAGAGFSSHWAFPDLLLVYTLILILLYTGSKDLVVSRSEAVKELYP